MDRYIAFLAYRYEAKSGASSFLSNYWHVVPYLAKTVRSLNPIYLRDVFSMALSHLSAHLNKSQSADTMVGEKTPVHTAYWKWILNELYPQARGVVVVRHPVTNIASILKRSSSLAEAKAGTLGLTGRCSNWLGILV